MPKSILITIQSKLTNFSSTEVRIAQFILDNPTEIPHLNTAELAEKTGTSPSSVVRFARKIGLKGYTELQMELTRVESIDERLYDEINPKDNTTTLKQKLALRINHSITTTSESLSNKALDQVVTAIESASHVIVYGLGASGLVAQDFVQKFGRVGKATHFITDTHQVAVEIENQLPKPLFFVISHSGETKEAITLAKIARDRGLKVVTLTSNATSQLYALGDYQVLTTGNLNEKALRAASTTSLICQLYAVDLLYYRYVQKKYSFNAKKIQESYRVVQENF
ncbi:MAG: MurR/RpiR family transcriptional regulator [Bavariicoccus seileri]|uniref:MurR/RpiR family transcriptional regulator n=1 Tax=Bavariicoccus seileri TaxID=549685 RepID=UPI0003B5F0B2|nr:MurR/RpiR family transcriptional regulator [Bavariicoccus seileri]